MITEGGIHFVYVVFVYLNVVLECLDVAKIFYRDK